MTSGHVVTVTLLSCNGYLKPKPASVSPSSCDSLSFARTRSRAHAHRNSGSWTVGNVSDIFMDVKTANAMSDIFFVLRAEGIGVVVGGKEGGREKNPNSSLPALVLKPSPSRTSPQLPLAPNPSPSALYATVFLNHCNPGT
ncbi:hypothetical protein C0Q70_09904 [Pomacea canaliculata]|uniref:Uncharacterized protein n=1 Tax=Pomacea canaliculata TaxID=400727 RepID=A0A2T7PB45_POMCA|nr:hypothetical protein C0Q70_09904 [Pomacea canaliculata]